MLARLALLVHAAVEVPAAVTFVFFPERQLPAPVSLETTLVLQNLGGLLAASAALSLMLAVWGTPPHISHGLRGAFCLCLASYHVFPMRRAYLRCRRGAGIRGADTHGAPGKTLGGPAVHLAVHFVCLVFLISASIADWAR